MLIKELSIILSKAKKGRISAHVKQADSEGMKTGSDMLRGKNIHDFPSARSVLEAEYGSSVEKLIFLIERTDWE